MSIYFSTTNKQVDIIRSLSYNDVCILETKDYVLKPEMLFDLHKKLMEAANQQRGDHSIAVYLYYAFGYLRDALDRLYQSGGMQPADVVTLNNARNLVLPPIEKLSRNIYYNQYNPDYKIPSNKSIFTILSKYHRSLSMRNSITGVTVTQPGLQGRGSGVFSTSGFVPPASPVTHTPGYIQPIHPSTPTPTLPPRTTPTSLLKVSPLVQRSSSSSSSSLCTPPPPLPPSPRVPSQMQSSQTHPLQPSTDTPIQRKIEGANAFSSILQSPTHPQYLRNRNSLTESTMNLIPPVRQNLYNPSASMVLSAPPTFQGDTILPPMGYPSAANRDSNMSIDDQKAFMKELIYLDAIPDYTEIEFGSFDPDQANMIKMNEQ